VKNPLKSIVQWLRGGDENSRAEKQRQLTSDAAARHRERKPGRIPPSGSL